MRCARLRPRHSALLGARHRGQVDRSLTLLLDAGADINKRTTAASGGRAQRRRTALPAAFWGWSDVVDFLVMRGAKIDVADPTGLTPVDAALGRAGGHGRGATIEVFDDTAARLAELCRAQPGCDLSQPERAP
jgi:hypothetical protein